MPELSTIVTIFFGWLLGLLTPGVAERIRRPYRRHDLMRAVVDEMRELQFTMANVAYRIRARRAEVTDAFLDEILPILEGYHGPESIEGFVERTKTNRAVPEEGRIMAPQGVDKNSPVCRSIFATVCSCVFPGATGAIRKQLVAVAVYTSA
jgi:hypothetical protein